MFYTFEELKDSSNLEQTVGMKASSLIRMYSCGFPVPRGGCIPTSALDIFIRENNLQEQLDELYNKLDPASKKWELERAVNAMQGSILWGRLPDEIMQRLEQFLSRQANTCFAVRSSGNKEDLEDASFAGQYTTFLNIRTLDNMVQAIIKCWASLFNTRILHYCLNRSINFRDMQLGVVIQEMVPADKSGVIFSINPTQGLDREIVVEACFGLGEALVSGEVNPDQYVFDWYREQEVKNRVNYKEKAVVSVDEPPYVESVELPEQRKNAAVLSSGEIRELADIAVDIQANYGYPVDIEWAKLRETFYILQCRPITTIYHSGIEGEWSTADFKDGGVSSTVCTPLMWSLYKHVWERSTPDYIHKVKFLSRKEVDQIQWGQMFYGRPYWNLSGIKKALLQMPGFVERDFDESMDIKPAYEGKGHVTPTNPKTVVKGIKVLMALKWNFRQSEKFWPRFKEKRLQKLRELEDIDPEGMDREEFFNFYQDFILNEYFYTEYTYFCSIYSSSNLASLFKEKFDKLKTGAKYLNLISGLSDVSHLQFNCRLWDVKDRIKMDPASYHFWRLASIRELMQMWKNGSSKFNMDDIRELVRKFKFHSPRELDISVPCYGEDPRLIMEHIKANMQLHSEFSPYLINEKQQEIYREERQKLLDSQPLIKKRRMDKALQELRRFLWWREELRNISTQFYYYVRLYSLVLARHFQEMNYIQKTDDVFFLSLQDILDILQGNTKRENSKRIVEKNRRYYDSFRNFNNPDEIGSRFLNSSGSSPNKGDSLSGLPCSPGEVTGRVKLIRNIYDADRLEKGDILVTKYTDPGWTPKFGLLSGVATETGGLLSHAAVISREYGIPAVLAVENLTSVLEDGQKVTLNGDTGEITQLD
ncbi:MAG: PEP/pyruvate-binding domain-containing protein [Thermodesulfobacteriota bacterium]